MKRVVAVQKLTAALLLSTICSASEPAAPQLKIFICDTPAGTVFQGWRCGTPAPKGLVAVPATAATRTQPLQPIQSSNVPVTAQFVDVPRESVQFYGNPDTLRRLDSERAQAAADAESRRIDAENINARAYALRHSGTLGGMMDARALEEQSGLRPPRQQIQLNCTSFIPGTSTCIGSTR
jgi:hypothetical protein